MKIGKAKRWNDTTKAWEFYYPATIAPALKDPNFKKADGTTVMTQGEINQQFKSQYEGLGLQVSNNMLCMDA